MVSMIATQPNRWGVPSVVLIAGLVFMGLCDAKPQEATGARPAVIADSPDSYVDARGRIVDKIDYPFVNDPQAVGKWKSVDFVTQIQDFDPATLKWKGDLYLKELVLLSNGRTSRPWYTWTKGLILHKEDRTAARYVLKDIADTTYMFFEWKSGDYSIRHEKPRYYVLKKVSPDVKDLEAAWSKLPSDEDFNRQLQDKIARLDIRNATLGDITKIFGEPGQYCIGTKGEDPSGIETIAREDVASHSHYIMVYPADFSIFMAEGRIGELRFRRPGYKFEGKLQVGDGLDDALQVLQPKKTVTGERPSEDGVLYKDVKGAAGSDFYAGADRHVRVFFQDGKVVGLFITRPDGPLEHDFPESPGRAGLTEFSRDLQAKADRLDLQTARREDVVKAFGEPTRYVWESSVFKADDLPSHYIMDYPDGFSVFMANGRIVELRFLAPNYVFKGMLKVGSSMEDAFQMLGQPDKTVVAGKCLFENGVYYKDNAKGGDYYARKERGVRLFARDDKIVALYVIRPESPE